MRWARRYRCAVLGLAHMGIHRRQRRMTCLPPPCRANQGRRFVYRLGSGRPRRGPLGFHNSVAARDQWFQAAG
jgi:hypothetical protein